jgi:hypothetical protein
MKGFVENQIQVAIIKQLPVHMWTPCREHLHQWAKDKPDVTLDECYEELNKFIYEKYAKEQGD